MLHDRMSSRTIVEVKRWTRRTPVARVDQHRRQSLRKRGRELLLAEVRRHDEQCIYATSHRLKGKRRLCAAAVQIGKKQQISGAARFAIQAAHELRKEL